MYCSNYCSNLVSNHSLIRITGFVLQFTSKLCNLFFISFRFKILFCRDRFEILNFATKQVIVAVFDAGNFVRPTDCWWNMHAASSANTLVTMHSCFCVGYCFKSLLWPEPPPTASTRLHPRIKYSAHLDARRTRPHRLYSGSCWCWPVAP